MHNYETLKKALEKEVYPHVFLFKFIGKNSGVFLVGIQDFEKKFPQLVKSSQRLSKNQNHLALTYQLEAQSPEEIMAVYYGIGQLPDLSMVL